MNIALGKLVEEPVKGAAVATDGQTIRYTGSKGYSDFNWPGTLTIDLKTTPKLRCVRFLLWDGLGQKDRQRDNRIYKYRLLTSIDHAVWQVLFDTADKGYNGWQVFNFPGGIEARYIRIHGLWNSANVGFHVVEVEAYADDPPPLDAEVTLQRTILSDSPNEERGDGLPIEMRVQSIINDIEKLIEENVKYLNPKPFTELIAQLRVQVSDVAAIEKSMDSIRREIIAPVKEGLEKSASMSLFSIQISKQNLYVGLVAGVITILSIGLVIVSLLVR